MTIINLKVEGSTKSVQFTGLEFGESQTDVLLVHEIILGDFNGSGVNINDTYVPMTQRQYDNIAAFKGKTTTYDADTDIVFPETNAQLKADINAQGNSIVAILGTNAETAQRVMALENSIEFVEFDEWSMIGTVITGRRGTRAVCRIDLGGDFDIGQVAYNDAAEDDGQRLLTITKGGVVRKFHTWTSNDLHAIQSQASNPQEGEIVSNVLKPTA